MINQADLAVQLRQIAGRATPLWDRLGQDFEPGSQPAEHEAILERWTHTIAREQPQKLAQRWEWSGFEPAKVLAGLNSPQLTGPLPAWTATLDEVLRTAQLPVDGVESSLVAGQPLPFEEILQPFIKVAQQRLRQQAGKHYDLLSPAAHGQLERHLLTRLSSLAAQALQLQFEVFRSKNDFSFLFGKTSDPTSRKHYAKFVAGFQLGAFFEEFSVLARLMCLRLEHWVDFSCEIMQHLAADLPDILELLSEKEPGHVTAIKANLSDTHNGGKNVIRLEFASGLKLIYKPRSVGMEWAYNELLGWFNRLGTSLPFKTVKVLDRKEYGWMEFVPFEPCRDTAGIGRYYRRMGMLVALVYMLEGTDCHFENVIASGEHPVLVDAEALMHPRVPEYVEEDPAKNDQLLSIYDSVVRTGLLPFQGEDAGNNYDFGAIRAAASGEVNYKVLAWQNINTDAMELVRATPPLEDQFHLPALESVSSINLADYINDLAEGFRDMYLMGLRLREEMLEPGGPIKFFKGQPVRFIFRNTKVYGLLQQRLSGPKYLRDGLERSLELEALSRAYMLEKTRPVYWPLLAAELAAMENTDIPFFQAPATGRSLTLATGEIIQDWIMASGCEEVVKRLGLLGKSDLDRQLGIIRTSLEQYLGLKPV